MSEQDVFIAADQALSMVVGKISQDQWAMKLPDWFQVGRTQIDPTLRDIINYHAFDEAWVPDVLAGKTIEQVGDNHSGDLLGQNPATGFSRLVAKAIAAVQGIGDLDKTVHLSYGDFPVREYLKHVTSFRGLRSYDIAKLIGTDTKMPPKLVQGLWDEISPEVEEWRKLGVYGPAVPVPENADLQSRLLGLVGRTP